MTKSDIYEPREDSELLETYVKKFSFGSVLDIGTGSGIQALTASKNKSVKKVIAVDISEESINYCKENIKSKKIGFFVSNLFEIFYRKFPNQKFDTIIFNPPYLPSERKLKDLTIESGKKGYEVISSFLKQSSKFLKTDGIILIVFSSLTNKNMIDDIIINNMMEFNLLVKKHFFFEDLYVYLIKKSEILKKIDKLKITDICFNSKGTRGIVFTGNYMGKKAGIKIANPNSRAISRIFFEAKYLKLLNQYKIGPKLLHSEQNFLVYEFSDGIQFADYIKKLGNENMAKNKTIILEMLKKIFSQLYIMDKLKINKEEMSHPHKHIIINKKNNPVLIDFEKSHFTLKPANVTQFIDFLLSNYISKLLLGHNIKIHREHMIELAKSYKKSISKKNLYNILKLIK